MDKVIHRITVLYSQVPLLHIKESGRKKVQSDVLLASSLLQELISLAPGLRERSTRRYRVWHPGQSIRCFV